MDIQDLLKTPHMFCIKKKGGNLEPARGVSNSDRGVKEAVLACMGIAGCDDPKCDCVDREFEKCAPGFEVVPVKMIEVHE